MVAICSYLMRCFGNVALMLKRIGDGPLPMWVKFIALLLFVPFFHVSHFFFKIAYQINERKLLMNHHKLLDEWTIR